MTYLQVVILSLIEGLTEFLPISSTGHLIIAQNLLHVPATEFTKSFNIIIQFSAILAIVVLYWKKITHYRHLWKQILIAFLPTGILGFTLYRLIKGYLLDNLWVTIIALFFGGLALLLIDHISKLNTGSNTSQKLHPKELVSIGLFQSLSMIPGVSRSAASIVGGLVNGLSRVEAVEFSFLLAIPTMTAASGYDLLKTGFSFTANEYLLILFGSLITFISASLAVKAFTSFVSKHNFTVFAIYRLILAIVVWVIFKP
jgi:undecaprenyl-diphosphatase